MPAMPAALALIASSMLFSNVSGQVLSPPDPVVPTADDGAALQDVLGEPFRAPGPFPDMATSAVVSLLPREGSPLPDASWAQLLAGGPIELTLNEPNRGDVSVNISPASPGDPRNHADHPVWGFQQTSSGVVRVLSGPPTYAWAPHASRGVLLASVAAPEHGADHGASVWAQAHATGTIGTQRFAPGYNMLDGHWRASPDIYPIGRHEARGNMWIAVQGIGSDAEAYAQFGVGWLPYADGWIGGHVASPLQGFDDLPSGDLPEWTTALRTRSGIDRIDFSRQDEGTSIPWVLSPQVSSEVYSVFEGSVTLDGGSYTLVAAGDDAFSVELWRDGRWERIVGVLGMHPMTTDRARVELPAGESRLRVRHLQGRGAWGLDLDIIAHDDGARSPLLFDPPGLAVESYSLGRPAGGDARWAADPKSGLEYRHAALADASIHWRDAGRWASTWHAVADVRSGALDPASGVMFAQPVTNNATLLTTACDLGDGRWAIQVADASTPMPTEVTGQFDSRRDKGFSFVYIPYDRADVLAVRSDARGRPLGASPGVGVRRLGEGVYRISLPEPAVAGTPFVQVLSETDQTFDRPTDLFPAWRLEPELGLVVEIRRIDWVAGEHRLSDAPFAVAWMSHHPPPVRAESSPDHPADALGAPDLGD